jgi:hypothetical protein
VTEQAQLLAARETLTPADHQTHKRYPFQVPAHCAELHVRVRYAPKLLPAQESRALAEAALRRQSAALAASVGEALAEQWAANFGHRAESVRVSNLLTISLDDATGTYRGAAHRQAEDQRLSLGLESASPGLVAGSLPAGMWVLTLSAHTLVSERCEVSIQIGAEIASSRP